MTCPCRPSVAATWDEARDTAFFVLVARASSPAFAAGATALLAANDADGSAWVQPAPRPVPATDPVAAPSARTHVGPSASVMQQPRAARAREAAPDPVGECIAQAR